MSWRGLSERAPASSSCRHPFGSLPRFVFFIHRHAATGAPGYVCHLGRWPVSWLLRGNEAGESVKGSKFRDIVGTFGISIDTPINRRWADPQVRNATGWQVYKELAFSHRCQKLAEVVQRVLGWFCPPRKFLIRVTCLHSLIPTTILAIIHRSSIN